MGELGLELSGLETRNGGVAAVGDYEADALRKTPLDWDAVSRVTCRNNCASQRGCSFYAFQKDGLVLRQELVGDFPGVNDAEVPDPNPRGCQKGLVYPHRIYAPSRLKYPLKRAGARGEGKWQRISWDQALTEIADTLLDVLATEGPGSVVYGAGSQGPISATDGIGYNALTSALDIPFASGNTELGDEMPGVALSFGKMVFGPSADNYHYADLILFWGGNPTYTTISYYQYYTAARYNGTKIVSISPDYSPSAIHADQWVPIKIGTDAALALSMAHIIVREKLYDVPFVREQTDLPFLVRVDTGKLLREKDLKRGGREDAFYMWDTAANRLAEAPRKSLALGDVVPALEGEYGVDTLQGRVTVRPVFELMRDRLREYAPESAATITGVSPDVITELARSLARAKGVMHGPHLNWGKMYHGDLIERAIVLLTALCGHVGKKGSCFWASGTLSPDFGVGAQEQKGDQILVAAAGADPRFAGWREDGFTDEMIVYEYTREAVARGNIVVSSLFFWLHAGLLDLVDQHPAWWDPSFKDLAGPNARPGDYLREALERGWHIAVPSPDKAPRVMFSMGGDFLRRVRASNTVIDTLLPKLRMLIEIDVRMTATGMYADYVLPACGWYEKPGLPLHAPTMHPFQTVITQAMEPLYESKNEWEMFCLLARRLDERARARGLSSFKDRSGTDRRLGNLYDKVTSDGLYTEDDLEGIVRDTYLNSENVEQMGWEEFKERGFAPYIREGKGSRSIGHSTDVRKGEPVIPLKWHVEGKQPYPTTSRRIQFYIDHDWYLKLGEALPAQKEDPKVGGDYPLRITGGHTRWSIHSTHMDDALLLRLQRGEPVMLVSAEDAQARGIGDGETVEAYNDVASFKVQVAVSPAVRPGQVIMYHGWINYQFSDFKHFKSVMAPPLNPVECAGGSGHLRPLVHTLNPGHSDRETRLDIRKVG